MQPDATDDQPVSADEQAADEQAADEEIEGPPEPEYGSAEPEAAVGRLTVADGFRFGCGFLLALAAFSFVLAILAAAVVLVAMLVGLPLPFGIP